MLNQLLQVMSPAQIRAIARQPDQKITLLEGSVSAGKTISSLFAFLIAVRNAPSNGLIVIVGKTLQTVYQNVFVQLQSKEMFGLLAAQVKYTRGATSANILGREVMVTGANDAKAEGKIRGATCALIYVDEATILPGEEYWAMLVTRLRVPGARLLATTNPGSRNHWLRINYMLRAAEVSMQVFSFKMRDNPSLTAEYIESMERTFTGVFYQRFILGMWTNAEGAIYDMWEPDVHVAPCAVTIVRKLVGVDYGTTNATAAVLLGLGSDRKLYVLDEWGHNARNGEQRWTDGQLSAGLRQWLTNYDGVEWIMVDPSAASFRTQLFADRVSNVDSADNSVVDGIRTVASFLAAGDLIIDPKTVNLCGEFPEYAWDAKATKHGEDKPLKEKDHWLDALRYAVMAAQTYWYNDLRRAA